MTWREVLGLRELVRHALTAAVYGIVISIILVLLTFALGNQQSVAVKYQKAVACELAVPIGPDGRDPALVAECFTNEGLIPPEFVSGF